MILATLVALSEKLPLLSVSASGESMSRQTNLNVLSIYGSEDGVLSFDKYKESIVNLPLGFVEQVIEGGNHAQFGDYGAQKGDNKASISEK